MLDLSDFVTERGGDIKKIKESQQKRFASEEIVDEVIALYEEARRGMTRITLPGIS
jgi:seryl-tRNA synthetase